MTFRDYDNDGDNDLLDEIIEEDLFCEDDPELEEHFVSLHKTLSSPKLRFHLHITRRDLSFKAV